MHKRSPVLRSRASVAEPCVGEAKLRKAAQIDDVRMHDLGHTVGTYARQTGANAFLVARSLAA